MTPDLNQPTTPAALQLPRLPVVYVVLIWTHPWPRSARINNTQDGRPAGRSVGDTICLIRPCVSCKLRADADADGGGGRCWEPLCGPSSASKRKASNRRSRRIETERFPAAAAAAAGGIVRRHHRHNALQTSFLDVMRLMAEMQLIDQEELSRWRSVCPTTSGTASSPNLSVGC